MSAPTKAPSWETEAGHVVASAVVAKRTTAETTAEAAARDARIVAAEHARRWLAFVAEVCEGAVPAFNAATAGRLPPLGTSQPAARRLVVGADMEHSVVLAVHEDGSGVLIHQREGSRRREWWLDLGAHETEGRIEPSPAAACREVFEPFFKSLTTVPVAGEEDQDHV